MSTDHDLATSQTRVQGDWKGVVQHAQYHIAALYDGVSTDKLNELYNHAALKKRAEQSTALRSIQSGDHNT